ncbi:MAG: hypothetical protein QW563_06865 [Candidatus Methanomethylicia archaeon]
MSSEEALIAQKIKRAARILLFQKHRRPGVRGYELKRILGKNYIKILDLLRRNLNDLGLDIKIVYDQPEEPQKPTEEQLEKAYYYVTTRQPPSPAEARLSGWRIDELAILSVALAYIVSKHGRANRKEIEEVLSEKFPQRIIKVTLDKLVWRGYLGEDDETLFIGWRSRTEVDLKELVKQILIRKIQ